MPPARATSSAFERTYDAPDRGRLGRPDEPGADRALVPADQRRLPTRRALPVRGQRRRRDPRLRTAAPAAGHLGLRRGVRPGRRVGGRAPAHARRRRRDDARARAHRHRPRRVLDQYGPGAVGVGWDGGLLGLGAPSARRLASATRSPGRCRTRDARSYAQQRGVGRREPGRRRGPEPPSRRRSRTRPSSTRRIRPRLPETGKTARQL